MIYTVTVSREEDNWLANVTNLDGAHTYAASLAALLRYVREVVRLVEDLSDDAPIYLDVEYDDSVPQTLRNAAQLSERRARLEQESAALAADTASTVAELVHLDLSVRDIGSIVGISPGRVSQITKAAS